jgi:hypothetical protein
MDHDPVVALLLAGEVDDQDVYQWCEVLLDICQLIVDNDEPHSWYDWVSDRTRGWSSTPADSLHQALYVEPILSTSALRDAATTLLTQDVQSLELFYRQYAAERAEMRARAAPVAVPARRHDQPHPVPTPDRLPPAVAPASQVAGRQRTAASDAARREAFSGFAVQVIETLRDKHKDTFESVPTAQLAKLTVDAIMRAQPRGRRTSGR